jgi:hypothetical protein
MRKGRKLSNSQVWTKSYAHLTINKWAMGMARTDRFLSCLLPLSPLVASVRRAANLLSTFLSREYQQHYQSFAPPIHQPRNSLDDYHASTCSSRCKAAFKLRIRCLTLRYNLSSSSYLIIPLFLFIARPLGSRPTSNSQLAQVASLLARFSTYIIHHSTTFCIPS